jgi:hypothetical protein
MKKLAPILFLVAVLASPATAGQVTVVNQGTSPGVILNVTLPIYSGGAYVGVENLLVGNVLYKGFCIDLSHFAGVNTSVAYTIDPLDLSPAAIPPGAMGVEKADFIKEMWAYAYADALKSNAQAAGFQLAIWGVLQGDFVGGVLIPKWGWLGGEEATAIAYHADDLIAWTNYVHDLPLANVVGLNPVDSTPSAKQSYAIVPDGGATLALLGGVLIGLGALRWKFSV